MLATSVDASDEVLAEVATTIGLTVVRGSRDDVRDRFLKAVMATSADAVVRLTADCPVTSQQVIAAGIATHPWGHLECVSNTLQPTSPKGLTSKSWAVAHSPEWLSTPMTRTSRSPSACTSAPTASHSTASAAP